MSLFGSSPPEDKATPPATANPNTGAHRSRSSLFDDEPAMTKSTSSALFQDDDDHDGPSPWDLPTPRKPQSRADVIRQLLPASDVPDTYIAAFDAVLRDHVGSHGRVASSGVARTLAAARLSADVQARINALLAPARSDEGELGRNEFNVLLALVGLAQEDETISLDSVDEHRRNLPRPKLPGILDESPTSVFDASELAAKPPQRPVTPQKPAANLPAPQLERTPGPTGAASMDYPDDPWNTPELHKNHDHGRAVPVSNGVHAPAPALNGGGTGPFASNPELSLPRRTTSTFTTGSAASAGAAIGPPGSLGSNPSGWGGFYDGAPQATPGFGTDALPNPIANPFIGGSAGRAGGGEGGDGGERGGRRDPTGLAPASASTRALGGGRTGTSLEESVLVGLMPEKEGMFMFQHHNYEVTSSRRGSKVVRRYSDFVWLLDCLHKRYPFRALPLLPPKRVAVNGNHFSNDGAFIEKRRRGLARFLNALVRHPILSQEQLVIMFLTVPTELSVWRKQATISVQDEFADRPLPPGLEDSLPPTLQELFDQTRSGIRRSAELYISICAIMDRLVKRSEGVAADHARIAMSLASLTETSSDTYATDTNDVPLLNDGLQAMSKHLRTAQTLLEDESRAWDEGVLEDLKRQRDSLVSLRDLFDRRDRLDKDNIPSLERRIQSNEAKLQGLRSKPEGLVKPGEIEKVVEAIIKDKESIVQQHNRSVFVKECLRDELIYFQSTQYHVSRWNQDWTQERVKYAEMLADNWRRLLDELDGMPLGD